MKPLDAFLAQASGLGGCRGAWRRDSMMSNFGIRFSGYPLDDDNSHMRCPPFRWVVLQVNTQLGSVVRKSGRFGGIVRSLTSLDLNV